MKWKPTRQLFWRMYLFGLLLLLAALVAAGIAVHLVEGDSPWKRTPERLGNVVDRELVRSNGDLEALQAHINQLHHLLAASIEVYDADGQSLAAAGPLTHGALSAEAARDLSGPEHIRGMSQKTIAVPLSGGRYLLMTYDMAPNWLRFALVVLAILASSAAVLYPLARGIARPLEKIAGAAKAFGEGQLGTRSGIKRCDEVGALAQAFDEMAARIERLVMGEKELLANISHELRTPLARMRVALALCEEHDDVDAIQARLGGVESDIIELDRLVEDVLTLARLDLTEQRSDGGFVLRRERVSVESLVEEALVRLEMEHPEVVAEVDFQGLVSPIEADPVLVRRTLDNLLENAVKYAVDPDAPGRTPIEVSVMELGDEAVIEVRDHGPGVSEEALKRLIEPFYRTDLSRGDGRGGVGLGLTLCRRVVETHGGQIEMSNAEPGLRVTMRYPLKAPEV